MAFIVVSAAALALAYLVFRVLSSKGLPYPPGPPQSTTFGNLHQLPKSEPWLTYAEWSRTYGPLVYLRLFTRKVLVLNSAQACFDLLENRSTKYSDRPAIWMYTELAERNKTVFSVPFHNPRFKKYRKLLNSGLNPRASREYRQLQEQETRMFLRYLVETPENFIPHIRRNAGAIVLKLAYGYSALPHEDPFVAIMEEAMHTQALLTKPGRWLIEAFPIMRFIPSWFPGAEFKRVAMAGKATLSNVDTVPYLWTKKQMETGKYADSFISRLLRPADGTLPDAEEEETIKWCTAALYSGGADTTVSALSTFFLMMILYPEVQKRAQAEIDSVVGNNRLPNLDDQEALGYVEAVIKETLRWAPVAPLGLPHRVTEDDSYKGYHIPAGAMVIANIWAICNDSELYPNPSVFDPERHLGSEPQVDPRKLVFGFGRRVCPGAHFAENSLFITISNVLATFDLTKEIDKDGREIEPKIQYMSGVTTHPQPFPCRIEPRFPDILTRYNLKF